MSPEDEVVVGFGAPTPPVPQFTPLGPIAPPFPRSITVETSPTGTPVVSQLIVKGATVIVGIAATLVAVLPPHTIGFKVCVAIVGFGTMFGIVSPGVRRSS
jgi:hypothetical protein